MAVQVDDFRLRVRDELAQLEGDVTLLTFSSGRLANQTESPVSLRATAQLTRPQAVRLALDGRMTLALDLDKNAIAFTGMKLDVEGDGVGIKGLSLNIDGALIWDGSALSAGPLQVKLNSASFGATSLAASSLVVKRALFNPRDKRLDLEALKLAITGHHGNDPLELSFDWPQLAVDPQHLKGSALSGRFKIAGPTPLAGDFHSAAPTGSFDALRVPGLVLGLRGSSGPRKVDAEVKADMVLNVGRSAAAVERLDVHATLADPGSRPLELLVAGSSDADMKTASWKLNGSLNADRFDTHGEATFGGAVPDIKAVARFDDLDLNKLLAPDKLAPTTTATAPADTPVQLNGLRAFNGQFALDAGALAFRQYKVADARLAATLDNGTLRVTRFSGGAWGGRFEASGSADAISRRVAVKLDASGVNVNALLKNVADKDLLEGSGHVTADVNSVGASVGALRSNLAGTAALQLRDGAIKGINLARSLRQAQAALSLKQDAITQGSGTERTDFSEMRASSRIVNGVAQSDDLDVKSPFLRIGGSGRFDIGRGRVDYLARVSVTDSALAKAAPVSMHCAE